MPRKPRPDLGSRNRPGWPVGARSLPKVASRTESSRMAAVTFGARGHRRPPGGSPGPCAHTTAPQPSAQGRLPPGCPPLSVGVAGGGGLWHVRSCHPGAALPGWFSLLSKPVCGASRPSASKTGRPGPLPASSSAAASLLPAGARWGVRRARAAGDGGGSACRLPGGRCIHY